MAIIKKFFTKLAIHEYEFYEGKGRTEIEGELSRFPTNKKRLNLATKILRSAKYLGRKIAQSEREEYRIGPVTVEITTNSSIVLSSKPKHSDSLMDVAERNLGLLN